MVILVNIGTASAVDDYSGISFDATLYGPGPGGNGSANPPSSCFNGIIYVHVDGGGTQSIRWQSGNPRCDEMIATWLNSNWQEDAYKYTYG